MRRRFICPILPGFAAIYLTGCSSEGIDPHAWTCPSLVDPIIEMSKDNSPKILEVSEVELLNNSPGYRIDCRAWAEWSDGSGRVSFDARVSNSGSVILEYRKGND